VADDTYDVFVSYSRADGRHAKTIDSVLRDKGLKTFFDRSNLAGGQPWVRALEQAIGAARAVIVLIGPRGLGNTQQYERELAFVRKTRDPDFPIVPVILPETTTDPPFDFLRVLTWIDFSHVAKVSDAPDVLEQLLRSIHGQPTSAETARAAICPYRGLDAFREEDAAFFFGRGSADDPNSPIGELVRKVREHPFVMVVGRSGSGKSSLVYAGLLPALRRERDRFWNVLSLRPGREPLRALAAAFNPRAEDGGKAEYQDKIGNEADKLRSGDPELLSHMIRQELDEAEGKPDRLLLYIDQWEELYAQAPPSSDKERAAQHAADVNRFIDLLLTAARTAPVAAVATVRADFYDPLIGHQEIKSLLPTRQVLLGKMLRSELQSTIVEPARKVGLTFDPPKLVQRILDEAGEDEGMLPLLQYALKESWALRKDNTITGDSYARSGGVREAIKVTAERAFEALSAEDQQAARQLFLRLVTPGEGQEDTRARAAMPSEPMQRRIVEQFAGPRTRLLVTGSDDAARPIVEVAHEALIRTWERLRTWIDENREKLRARAAVVQAKAVWEQQGRREDLLLPAGFQLERARELIADPGDLTVDDIQEFISASVNRDDDERNAREQERLAYVAALEARADAERKAGREAAARADEAKAAAIQAAELQERAEKDRDIAKAASELAKHERSMADLARKDAERRLIYTIVAGVIAVGAALGIGEALNRGSRKVDETKLQMVENTSKLITQLIAQKNPKAGIIVALNALSAFKGEGEQDYPPTSLWSSLFGAVITGSLESAWASSNSSLTVVSDAHHTPTTDRVVTAARDGSARLCEIREAMQVNCVGIHDFQMASVLNVALAGDGTRLATAHEDGTTRIWTIGQSTQPELSGLLRDHSAPVHHVAFSQDTAAVATASEDGTARLWTLRSSAPPKLQLTLEPGRRGFQYITPVTSGALTVDSEGHVRLWQLKSAGSGIELTGPISGLDTPITAAGIDYSGLYLFTISKRHTLCLWKMGFQFVERVEKRIISEPRYYTEMTRIGCIDDVLDARYVPLNAQWWHDEREIVFITSDGIIHFWNVSDYGSRKFKPIFDLNVFSAKSNPRFLSFAQDGSHLLIFAETNHLWRVQLPRTPFESIMTGCALMSRADSAGPGDKDVTEICSRPKEAIDRLSRSITGGWGWLTR
jgi:WD40 repeat protein